MGSLWAEEPPLGLLVFSSEGGTGSPKWGACPVDNGHLCATLGFPRGEFQAGF